LSWSALSPPPPFQRGRWVMLTLVGLTAIVIGVAGLTIRLDHQGRQASVAAEARLLSGVLALGLQHYLDQIDLELRDLSQGSFPPTDPAGNAARVAASFRHLPGVHALDVLDNAGRPVAGARAGAPVLPERAEVEPAFFATLRDQTIDGLDVSEPLRDMVSGQRMLFVGRRVLRADGGFGGIVRVTLKADNLLTRLLPEPQDSGLHISLLTQRMEFLTRHPSVAEVEGGAVSRAVSPELQILIEKGTQAASYSARSRLDGQERIAFLRRAGGHPFYFSVGFATETFLIPWRNEGMRVGGLILAFLGLVVLVLRAWRQRGEALAALEQAHGLARDQADRLHRILRGANDGWWEWDLEQGIIDYSPHWWEMLGETSVAQQGPPALWQERIHPEDRARVTAELVAAWRGDGGAFQSEFRLCHHAGHYLPVLVRSLLQRAPSGRVVRMSGTVTDLSGLRQVEARLQAMFDLSPLGCCLCDAAGRISDANPALLALVKTERAALLGQSLAGLLPQPDGPEEEGRQAARLATEGRFGPYERLLMLPDGREVPVRLRGVRLEEGTRRQADLIYTLVEDISEERAVLRILEERTRDLARSNADLEQFAYVASHDLREPLRMVSSFLGLLERRYGAGFNEEARQFIDFAKDGARRMDQLILDLLDFSRIGRENLALASIPLRLPLDRALANLAVGISESAATIEIASACTTVTVRGDPSQLTSLFQNLIGNALKYRAPDRPPRVILSVRRDGEDWDVTVADNGIGIEPDYFERIFRLFQRLHNREAYDGTGIGLALCKKIVERHGGRIWVESTPGTGSVFHVTLPVGATA